MYTVDEIYAAIDEIVTRNDPAADVASVVGEDHRREFANMTNSITGNGLMAATLELGIAVGVRIAETKNHS